MPLSAIASPAVERVLGKLKNVKAAGGDRWMALCPTHDDSERSLSIKVGADGRVLMHCHAGCDKAAIVLALGLTMGDLFAEPMRPKAPSHPVASLNAPAPVKAQGVAERPRLTATYDYTDANGALLFQACRFTKPDGGKTFRQRRPDPAKAGDWTYDLNGIEPVLYRLPSIIEAVSLGRTVYVVEGEKDADALAAAAFPATTSPMGAGKWRESYADVLAGANVVILPDNDDPGRAHALQIAASLHARNCFVKVVNLPGLPAKGDVSDWIGVMGRDFDQMEDVIDKAARWTPDEMEGRHRVLWRLDELWQNDSIMRPPPPIVPRLAWSGRSTLLAAREKSGKSTLVGYIAAAVTNGGFFLEERCATGDVLIVSLEEYAGDTARRLRHFQATATRVHLKIGWTGDPQSRPQELADAIDTTDPILVILDSLAAYSGGLIQDDNNATQMASVVQPLTDLCHSRGVALIIIHHARKSDGKSRGSTAITAAADVVCEYFAPSEDTDPTLRRMRSAGRVPVQPVYDLRFDGDHYELATSSDAPISSRILRVVSERPGCSINDVAQAITARREDVAREVHAMLASGTLGDLGEHRARPKLVVATAKNMGLAL